MEYIKFEDDVKNNRDIDLEKYTQNITGNTSNVNQESMDLRLQNLYIEEMEKNISKRLENEGYNVSKCNIDANLDSSSENSGIHSINLNLSKKKIDIDLSNNVDDSKSSEAEKIKEDLSNYYNIDKNLINVKIK